MMEVCVEMSSGFGSLNRDVIITLDDASGSAIGMQLTTVTINNTIIIAIAIYVTI